MDDAITVARLRERGWTIPDGLTMGDMHGHAATIPAPHEDVYRRELYGRRVDDLLRDEHWTRGDELHVATAARKEDNAAMREHWAMIGVVQPAESLCCG